MIKLSVPSEDQALKFIRVQRCDHERLITENLMAMHKGDYCVVMSKRELCIADREENEKALMKYRLILWSGTRLSEEEENND